MVFSKAQAVAALPTAHDRVLDAAITHVDSALQRFTGSHVDVPIHYLIPPGEITEQQQAEFVQKLMGTYTTAGWHPIQIAVNGIQNLRFS